MGRQAVTVQGTTVQPGERGFGFLHVGYLAARTEVRIPFQVINGAHEGPVLLFESGLQGWEPMGAEIIRRALNRIDPKQLRGTIYALPFTSPPAVEIGGTIEGAGGRVNPIDQLDMNRVWPGKLTNGWLTEQMAGVMWNDIVTRCEYLLDLHDGTGSCEELPVAFPKAFPEDTTNAVGDGAADGVGEATVAGGASAPARLTTEKMRAMNDQIRELAIAFGAQVTWWRPGPVNPAMLSGSCMLNGIIPIVAECGGGHSMDLTIDQGVECSLNVFKHLKMIDGDLVLPKKQIMVSNYVVYRSQTGGFYQAEPHIQLGTHVKKGETVGRIVDPVTSAVVEECRSPVNGIIISRRVRMPMNPGSYVIHVADTDAIIWERTNP